MREPLSGGGGELFEFADFTLRVRERRLTYGGHPVHLAAKTFDVLIVLLRRPGQLVTKQQLLKDVWAHVYVEAGILTVHVAALRKVLGDSRTTPRFIETVSGYGYRFVADVRREDLEAVMTRAG